MGQRRQGGGGMSGNTLGHRLEVRHIGAIEQQPASGADLPGIDDQIARQRQQIVVLIDGVLMEMMLVAITCPCHPSKPAANGSVGRWRAALSPAIPGDMVLVDVAEAQQRARCQKDAEHDKGDHGDLSAQGHDGRLRFVRHGCAAMSARA